MGQHRAPSPGDALEDPGYAGPAELIAGEQVIPVDVTLVGNYRDGRFHWYGRVAAHPGLAQMGGGPVVLRTPFGSAETALEDVDPWGRPRVSGFGRPPFELPVDVRR